MTDSCNFNNSNMHNISNKLILVTGGAGYIGSTLVPKLLERGYNVRVFDKLVFGDFGLEPVKSKIEIIKGDVVNPDPKIMEGVYGVIHLAGLSTDPVSDYSPRQADLINHLGTENIARLAKNAGVERFVFASSASVYFTYDTPDTPPLYREHDKINSVSAYSLSKRAAEEALMELADEKFQPTIFRKGTIYGFSPKMRYDLVLNSFTKDAFRSGKITVNAGGLVYRPMLDLQDAVAAYAAALEAPIEKIGRHIFNLNNGNWKIGDLAADFKNMFQKEKNKSIEINVKPPCKTRNYQMDNAKFSAAFGLVPGRTASAAMLEMWKKLEEGHDYNDPRFYTDVWHKQTVWRDA